MRASLDTNVIIHFYKAGLQEILFTFFDEGVFIYEQVRNIVEDMSKSMNRWDSDLDYLPTQECVKNCPVDVL